MGCTYRHMVLCLLLMHSLALKLRLLSIMCVPASASLLTIFPCFVTRFFSLGTFKTFVLANLGLNEVCNIQLLLLILGPLP